MDTHFLCSDQRMDTELVDKLVLQLNRIYPQILTDKEAHRVTIFVSETVVMDKSPHPWAEVVPATVFLLVVQELECSHQGASGRAAETPLWEGRGGMWRVLQGASPSSRGCLHRPANKGLTKRWKIGPEHTFPITEAAENRRDEPLLASDKNITW